MPLVLPAASTADAYAAMLGLVGAPFPVGCVNNDNLGATSGFLLLSLIRPTPGPITNLGVWLCTAGTAPGSSSMALFSTAGAQLGVTGDMTSALTNVANAGTYVKAPMTSTYTGAANTDYYVGLFTALTGDAKIAGSFSGSGIHIPSVNGNRLAIVVGGLSGMPSSVDVAGATTAAAVYWLAAS